MKPTGERIELRNLRIAAVLNSSSGGCGSDGAAKMASILGEYRIALTSIDCVDGKGITTAVKAALEDRTDILIVLGGDGTIRTAGELCAQTQTKLIPLPGGTMNMLPKALYGNGHWNDVLNRTLASPTLVDVGGGDVDGHRFFCAGIFGSPAMWADAREAIRKNRWMEAFEAAVQAYHRSFSREIRYRFDGGKQNHTVALSAICPLISATLSSDDRAFEMVLIDPGSPGDAAHLAWQALFADWRNDRIITSIRADKVQLSAGGRMPALLDGEKVYLHRSAEIRYLKACFKAIVPTQTR